MAGSQPHEYRTTRRGLGYPPWGSAEAAAARLVDQWFVPEGGTLRGRVPNAFEVRIDWSKLKDPVNTVIADLTWHVSHAVCGHNGRGRALLHDLTDGSVETTDWIEARGPGLHRYDYPAVRRHRFGMPNKAGVHTYVLEVEVSDADTRATAVGTLIFGH